MVYGFRGRTESLVALYRRRRGSAGTQRLCRNYSGVSLFDRCWHSVHCWHGHVARRQWGCQDDAGYVNSYGCSFLEAQALRIVASAWWTSLGTEQLCKITGVIDVERGEL